MKVRQLDYWGTWEDSRAIACAILGTGQMSAFVDGPYAVPEVTLFDALVPELEVAMKRRGGLSLIVKASPGLPPEFGRWDVGEHAGHYYVKGGGPFVQFASSTDYSESGKRVVGPGRITISTSYYDGTVHREVRVSDAALDGYLQCVRVLKSFCTRVGIKKRWVGNVAARLIDEGDAEIRSPGFFS